MGHIERIGAPASPRFRPSVTPGPGYPSCPKTQTNSRLVRRAVSIVIDPWRAPDLGASEAMSAIRVPRTRRENTVQQRDACGGLAEAIGGGADDHQRAHCGTWHERDSRLRLPALTPFDLTAPSAISRRWSWLEVEPVLSKNTNELKTGAPGRFDRHRPVASPRSGACRRRCRRFGFSVRAGKTTSSKGMPRSRVETWIQAPGRTWTRTC